MLQFTGSQRVGHDWVTEQQQQEGVGCPWPTGDSCCEFGRHEGKVGFFSSSGLWWLLSHRPYVFLGTGFHSPQH